MSDLVLAAQRCQIAAGVALDRIRKSANPNSEDIQTLAVTVMQLSNVVSKLAIMAKFNTKFAALATKQSHVDEVLSSQFLAPASAQLIAETFRDIFEGADSSGDEDSPESEPHSPEL